MSIVCTSCRKHEAFKGKCWYRWENKLECSQFDPQTKEGAFEDHIISLSERLGEAVQGTK
ncbi:MAG: hypothetical protein H6502_01255 [Candidatus Woesearchaeota archaeon]|nr:MAG: hypothetical protein H6502_01255 [Candidatus Woesearchaeota archaeon]